MEYSSYVSTSGRTVCHKALLIPAFILQARIEFPAIIIIELIDTICRDSNHRIDPFLDGLRGLLEIRKKLYQETHSSIANY